MQMRKIAAILLAPIVLWVFPESTLSQSIPDLVAISKPGVAFVIAQLAGEKVSVGSGLVVAPGGVIVTAQHVVENGQTIGIVLGKERLSAKVVLADKKLDIAVVSVARKGLYSLLLGDSSAVQQGEEIIVIGYPYADILGISEPSVTRGIVSKIETPLGWIQIDAAINPGNSGGPVLNRQGQVIGIAIAGLRGAQGINFAVPAEAIKPVLAPFLSSVGSPGMRTIPKFSSDHLPYRARWESNTVLAEQIRYVNDWDREQRVRVANRNGKVIREIIDHSIDEITFVELTGKAPSNCA
jgi:S1-C subfamily serine protease